MVGFITVLAVTLVLFCGHGVVGGSRFACQSAPMRRPCAFGVVLACCAGVRAWMAMSRYDIPRMVVETDAVSVLVSDIR